MDKIRLSIIIPSYNENKNLQNGVLEQVNNYLRKQKYSYEVLIVDDGSTDTSANLIKSKIKNWSHFKLIQNPHAGKALTVISGMMQSNGEISIFTDMDQATPIDQIERLLPKFDEGFDIVIGSRHGREGAPLIRQIVAAGFSVLRNIILGLPFKDTQCGFKAFNRKSVQKLFPKLQSLWQYRKSVSAAVNAGFDVEMLYVAKVYGYKIAEVGVHWHHAGSERVQIVRDAYEAVCDMIRIKMNSLTGLYEKD